MRHWLLGIVFLCSPSLVIAASTLEFQAKQGEYLARHQVYIDKGRLLIKSLGVDGDQDLIFDNTKKTLSLINHRSRSYVSFDEQTVITIARQAKQLQQLFGISSDIGSSTIILKPGKNLSISGYPCKQINVFRKNVHISEVCITDPQALGIPIEDLNLLKVIQYIGESLTQNAGQIINQLGANIPEYGFSQLNGMPIAIIDLSQVKKSSLNLISVQSGIGEVKIKIPSGYTPQSFPSLLGF